jgi:quercetin dioxygenase-like cupin family protein
LSEERITLLDLEPIRIEEARFPSSAAATVPEYVYVLEGELMFRLERLRVGPGTWVFVPPDAAQVVAGEDGARLLGMQTAVGHHTAAVLARSGATAEAVEVSGNRVVFLADVDETGSALGAIEFIAPRAFTGPPAHVHRGFHDIVFVLDGTIEARVGDEVETVGPGALLHAPPGVAHTFSNPSDAPLRFLNLYVPGGFERFFRERATAADGAELTSRYDWERA